MVGKSLSHYKITAELGRGGMGIVYQAQDTKLDRTVAIKVLPSAALASEDDRARFYREAKAAAQLHHPHIASVFEIDEAVPEGSKDDDLRPFIAMEFIEGETLHDRIQKGPLKLEEAVRIASQIASGLKAAHAKDIVHRDIKGGNIMLTEEGDAKILDFGLAQTAASTKLTRMGSTLGTVAYMSPEQATGSEVDGRTDIWSLGVILYEMISGQSPFPGEYDKAVIYSILNQDAEPLTALRTGVPMGLEWIVSKCLAKKTEDRYQSVAELIVDLRNVDLSNAGMSLMSGAISGAHTSHEPWARETDSTQQTKVFRPAFLVAGFTALLLAVWLGYSLNTENEGGVNKIALHTSITFPANEPVALIGSAQFYIGRSSFDLTMDDRLLVYVAELVDGSTKLAVREMDGFESRIIPDTEGAFSPFFSPDGSQIGYFAKDQLKVVPVSDGTSTILADVRNPRGGVWTAQGEIIYSDNEGSRLRKINALGGEAEYIGTNGARQPARLPDGGNVLAVTGVEGTLSIVSVSTGEIITLGIGQYHSPVANPTYANSGHILYMQNARLMAVPFDAEKLKITGQPVPMIENVRNELLDRGGHYAVSESGTLVYAPGGDVRVGHLVVVTGQDENNVLPFDPRIFGEMRLSPNGTQLAIAVLGARWDIWIYDIDRLDTPQRLTFEGNNFYPVWTPDGERIYFMSDRSGRWQIYSSSASSSGDLIQLNPHAINQRPESISNDGKWLLVLQEGGNIAFSLDGDSTIQSITTSAYGGWGGTFSPDGKSIAYMSQEAGTYDVYVKSFSDRSKYVRLSTGGGMDPIWSSDGKTIYFNYVREVYSVDVDPTNDYSHESPKHLFSGDFVDLQGKGWAYDESGDRFIFVQTIEKATVAEELYVISNWFEELKRLAPPSE